MMYVYYGASTPDLFISAVVVLPARVTNPNERYTEIVAGVVNEFSIDISVSNRGVDSFGTQMVLTLPPGISFRIAAVETQDLVIGCQNPQVVYPIVSNSSRGDYYMGGVSLF